MRVLHHHEDTSTQHHAHTLLHSSESNEKPAISTVGNHNHISDCKTQVQNSFHPAEHTHLQYVHAPGNAAQLLPPKE